MTTNGTLLMLFRNRGSPVGVPSQNPAVNVNRRRADVVVALVDRSVHEPIPLARKNSLRVPKKLVVAILVVAMRTVRAIRLSGVVVDVDLGEGLHPPNKIRNYLEASRFMSL